MKFVSLVRQLWLMGIFIPMLLFSQSKFYLECGTQFDFGDISNMETVKRLLSIKNIGTDTLIITDVGATCGCTATLLSNDHIPPNDSGTLHITFDARRFSGKVNKMVSMLTNDTSHRRVEIHFTANVIKIFELDPEYIFFRSIKDSTASQTMTVRNVSSQTIKILSATPSSKFVTAKFSENEVKPNEELTLITTFTPNTDGTLSGNIDIKTDYPKLPQMSIRFIGWASSNNIK